MTGVLDPRAARVRWPIVHALGPATAVPAVALIYGAGRAATSVILGPDGSGRRFDTAAEVFGAVVVAVTLVTLASRLAGPPTARIRSVWLVALASVAAVMLEGSAFDPAASPLGRLPLGLLLEAGTCLAAAFVACASVRPAEQRPEPGRVRASRTRLLLPAAMVYVVLYLAAGAIDYLLVTGPYYAAHAGGLTTPPAEVVLAVALAEGLLLAAATVPMASALSGSRRSRGLACGLALWMLGGVVPLIQASSIPDVVRVASVLEILFQKVPLGIAVVWLIDRPAAASEGRRS